MEEATGLDHYIAAYLDRLGLDREPPSVEALARLHRAHVERVPYETLWIPLGEDWTVDPVEVPTFCEGWSLNVSANNPAAPNSKRRTNGSVHYVRFLTCRFNTLAETPGAD
jgi:hypothetical protein